MERFPEKLRETRKRAKMSQDQLAEAVGVSRRSLTAYETGVSLPRKSMMRKLAEALNVTVEYLSNDNTDDQQANRKREDQVNAARTMFGGKGAKEAEALFERNATFFAGGDIDQESKDAFFDALMAVYLECKTEARAKFTPKSKRRGGSEKEE